MLAIERTVKRARRSLDEYKKIKCCEIEAFLFHFDMLWEGCAYLPKHVSEAMDQIQKAVALDRGVLEGYLVNAPADLPAEAGKDRRDVGNSGGGQ